MYKFVLSVFCCLFFGASSNAFAADPHFSNVKVSAFKSGVYTVSSGGSDVDVKFFCVRVKKSNFEKDACVTSQFGKAKEAFDSMHSIAYSSYLARADVKAFIIDNSFTDTNFIADNSPHMLTQLSTCDLTSCF
ncbi:subtilase family AB5 toxin binding subunit [Plesiomonas shigelloides]|uniref:subtilase family AB5 toxin binding subunit n=1 Tax=Plesiomonas shigelloides TaxID=703 RepID=UPI0012E0A1D7|nr:subtilase family AB5 toxin binding subunit [Plesiomonas shigelloides]